MISRTFARQGTTKVGEGAGPRAIALIEDIWCEKIRRCSYGGMSAEDAFSEIEIAVRPIQCPYAPRCDQDYSLGCSILPVR
jgi:hypothetical protein